MKKLMSLFIVLIIASTIVRSQEAENIINKYFENTGGLEKWKSLKTIVMTGKVASPQGDISFKLLKKTPNLIKTEAEVMGQVMVPQAFDGEIVWSINPFSGSSNAVKMEDKLAAMIIDQAEFEDPLIDYTKKGHEVALEGKEDVNGTECYKIKLTKNKNNDLDDIIMYFYFDSEFSLPLLLKLIPSAGEMAGQEVDIYMSDYKEVENGLMMPFSIEQKMGGVSSQKITVDSIRINQEIADDVFKYPGE